MSLRERLKGESRRGAADRLYNRFGILANPFPASNQTSANPHRPIDADAEVEKRIITFLRDRRSQVVVVEGTQGVGKTNFLNHIEAEILSVMRDLDGYYMVRYLADPEPAFDGTTRRLFEELGTEHLAQLRDSLKKDRKPIGEARGHDMRRALHRLVKSKDEDNLDSLMMEWLLGLRVLKVHRQSLGIQFRLDTVESKTAALRDLIQVSAASGVLKGMFLLLDELEKQGGVLGPTAVIRYLSALRSVVDALPEHLFLMIGITPDALLRYSTALPALRGRLQNQISLEPLTDVDDALDLADFYLRAARRMARGQRDDDGGDSEILKNTKVESCFEKLLERAERAGNRGVTQRAFLHELHDQAEKEIQSLDA